jgi:hypothetical protein
MKLKAFMRIAVPHHPAIDFRSSIFNVGFFDLFFMPLFQAEDKRRGSHEFSAL